MHARARTRMHAHTHTYSFIFSPTSEPRATPPKQIPDLAIGDQVPTVPAVKNTRRIRRTGEQGPEAESRSSWLEPETEGQAAPRKMVSDSLGSGGGDEGGGEGGGGGRGMRSRRGSKMKRSRS